MNKNGLNLVMFVPNQTLICQAWLPIRLASKTDGFLAPLALNYNKVSILEMTLAVFIYVYGLYLYERECCHLAEGFRVTVCRGFLKAL